MTTKVTSKHKFATTILSLSLSLVAFVLVFSLYLSYGWFSLTPEANTSGIGVSVASPDSSSIVLINGNAQAEKGYLLPGDTMRYTASITTIGDATSCVFTLTTAITYAFAGAYPEDIIDCQAYHHGTAFYRPLFTTDEALSTTERESARQSFFASFVAPATHALSWRVYLAGTAVADQPAWTPMALLTDGTWIDQDTFTLTGCTALVANAIVIEIYYDPLVTTSATVDGEEITLMNSNGFYGQNIAIGITNGN